MKIDTCTADAAPLSGHACQLFRAEDIYVSAGANLGDGLDEPVGVCPGDVYELADDALPERLVVAWTHDSGTPTVAAHSGIGNPGDPVTLSGRYTLMAPDGDKVELVVLRLDGARGGLYALPLSPMGSRIEYTLLKVEEAPGATRLSDLLCVSFARGTMITLANGSQRMIEALLPGDRVLTRDRGAQDVRWIGRATLRAVGAFAPVVICKDAMGNAGDLIVSQHHRMFLYNLSRNAGQRTSELLVQAKHLVNGETVFVREGGFVDYFSLVFDRHEIIYAEGIPAESLMVNEATVSRLPADLAEDVKARFPGLSQNQHFGTEASRQMQDAIWAAPGRQGAGAAR